MTTVTKSPTRESLLLRSEQSQPRVGTFTIATTNMSSPLHGIGSRQRRGHFRKKSGCHESLCHPRLCGLACGLVVALDASLARKAIDRSAQSEGYIDIQSVMTVTNAPIRL